MVENLKMSLLPIFVMNTVLDIISPLLEHLNKMELLREKIGRYKKWQEPYFAKTLFQNIFGAKLLILHILS